MLPPIRLGLFALVLLFLLATLGLSAQTRPEPLPPLDSLGYGTLNALANTLFEHAGSLKPVFAEMNEQASEGLRFRQAHLEGAKADSTVSKSKLDSLAKAVKAARSQAKKRTQQLDRAEKAWLFSGEIRDMTDSLLIRKSLPKAWQQINQLYDELYPPLPVEKVENEAVTTDNPPLKKEKKKKGSTPNPPNVSDNASTTDPPSSNKPTPDAPNINKPAIQSKQFAKYNPARDVMLNPPTPPCSIASGSRDEFSGEISRELSKAELFRFTNPALKNYLKGKTHVVCEAALASTGPNAMLILTFQINDPNARIAFGRLEKNSMASLRFLDGNVLELKNSIADDGVFAPENESSIFQGHYPLSPEIFKKIRKSELDTIRIIWSKGYDDYEVQQVDLLMRQAECLFK